MCRKNHKWSENIIDVNAPISLWSPDGRARKPLTESYKNRMITARQALLNIMPQFDLDGIAEELQIICGYKAKPAQRAMAAVLLSFFPGLGIWWQWGKDEQGRPVPRITYEDINRLLGRDNGGSRMIQKFREWGLITTSRLQIIKNRKNRENGIFGNKKDNGNYIKITHKGYSIIARHRKPAPDEPTDSSNDEKERMKLNNTHDKKEFLYKNKSPHACPHGNFCFKKHNDKLGASLMGMYEAYTHDYSQRYRKSAYAFLRKAYNTLCPFHNDQEAMLSAFRSFLENSIQILGTSPSLYQRFSWKCIKAFAKKRRFLLNSFSETPREQRILNSSPADPCRRILNNISSLNSIANSSTKQNNLSFSSLGDVINNFLTPKLPIS